MDTMLKNWLTDNGFNNTTRDGLDFGTRFDKGSLRVCDGIDEVAVIMFTGRPGYSGTAWELRFAAPEGRLSMPVEVVIATIRAAGVTSEASARKAKAAR